MLQDRVPPGVRQPRAVSLTAADSARMAFITSARTACCAPLRQQPVCGTRRPVVAQKLHHQLSRQKGFVGNLKLCTTSNKPLRWSVCKPGRGGRLTVEAAHSAIPKAAGLYDPASDKVGSWPLTQPILRLLILLRTVTLAKQTLDYDGMRVILRQILQT